MRTGLQARPGKMSNFYLSALGRVQVPVVDLIFVLRYAGTLSDGQAVPGNSKLPPQAHPGKDTPKTPIAHIGCQRLQ